MITYQAVLYVCNDDATPVSIIINGVLNAVEAIEAIDKIYPFGVLVSLERK